jgi:hypothetical protein
MMTARTSAALIVAIIMCVASSEALADDKACNESYEQGQVLRKDNNLLEARETFRTCVNICALDAKRKNCADWLAQVERDIPTLVPSAKDSVGGPLADVTLSVDNKPLATKLEGRSVEINPGLRTFSFQLPDGTKKEIRVLVEEGKKDTPVVVTFDAPAVVTKAPETRLTVSSPADASGTQSRALPEVAPSAASAGPWKAIGLAMAGGGIVGLVLGTVFGLQASSKKTDAACDSNSVCRSQAALDTLHGARDAGDLSTTFFVVGGVLAAGGITMWALAPRASVQVAPTLGERTASVVLRGAW